MLLVPLKVLNKGHDPTAIMAGSSAHSTAEAEWLLPSCLLIHHESLLRTEPPLSQAEKEVREMYDS